MIETGGGRSLGCSPDAIALCGDKLRCGEHLRARGIATPPSVRVVPRDGLPRDHPYPAVLKPIDGAGSLDTYCVESPDDLHDAVAAMPEALLQPFVPGSAMSAAFLVAEERRASAGGRGRAAHRAARTAGSPTSGGGCPSTSPDLAPVLAADQIGSGPAGLGRGRFRPRR